MSMPSPEPVEQQTLCAEAGRLMTEPGMAAFPPAVAPVSAGLLPVNWVGPLGGRTGIGRYGAEMATRLGSRVALRSCSVSAGALSGVPLLRQLPLSISGLDATAVVHFSLIVGAGAA